MTSASLRVVLVLALLLGSVSVIVAGEKKAPRQPTKEEFSAAVQRDANILVHELDRLEEDVMEFLVKPETQQAIYRQVELVLQDAENFARGIKPAATAGDLLERHRELDRKVHALLKSIRALDTEQRIIQRSADFVNIANEELYYTLLEGDPDAKGSEEALRRQADAMLTAARKLEQTARYSLAGDLQGGVIRGKLKELITRVEKYHKSLDAKADEEQRRQDFKQVDQAWMKVTQSLGLLQPVKHVYLLRAATRFDHLHHRMYRLLGIESQRPGLIIQS